MALRASAALVTWFFVLMTAAGADAQGVAFAVFNGPYPDAALHRLDLSTGALTRVGAVGYPVDHIAFDSRGSLYGVDAAHDQLVVIDVGGGSAVPVGALGVGITIVEGLTFDAVDRLWMTALDEVQGPSLFEIDRATGLATWVAGIAWGYFGSLASDGDTVFMASHYLAVIDTEDGTVVGVPGSYFGIWNARAVDFDRFGALRGLMLCGPCMTPEDILAMRTIDPATGTIVSEGPGEPHGTWGLAILQEGLFFDGFESGDATAWSVSPHRSDAWRFSVNEIR